MNSCKVLLRVLQTFGWVSGFLLLFYIPSFADSASFIDVKTDETDPNEPLVQDSTPLPLEPLAIQYTYHTAMRLVRPPVIYNSFNPLQPIDPTAPLLIPPELEDKPKLLQEIVIAHRNPELLGAHKGQLRLDIHSYSFHIAGRIDDRSVFDIRKTNKILYGMGFEYLITNVWGIKGIIDIGSEQLDDRSEEGFRRTLFHSNLIGTYHVTPNHPLDILLQFGIGLITASFSGEAINEGGMHELGIINSRTQGVQFTCIGMGINYFFTKNMFAGFEGFYIIWYEQIKNGSKSAIQPIEVNRLSWQTKLGFAF